jgi:N-methylhydantoinase A
LAAAVNGIASKVQGNTRRTFARVRYRGQGHELEIPLGSHRQPESAAPTDGAEDGHSIAQRFAAAHQARYGFALPAEVEVVALRHEAGEPARAASFVRDPAAAPYDATHRVDAGGPADGIVVRGPATIALPDATLFVAAGWRAAALLIGGWRLTRDAAGTAR